MRYATLALALFALACPKAQPSSEPDASVEAAAEGPSTPRARSVPPPPPQEAAPVLTRVTVGKPPLMQLRRSFEVGSKEVLRMETEETISMKGGGWDSEYTPPVRVQVIDFETKAVSEDGVATVALRVRKVTEIEKSVENANAHQMDTTGVTGTYEISAQGVITELDINPPPRGGSKANLDAMRGQVRWMAPPFPTEPVGAGATWTVTGVANEYQTQMKEQVDVELLELTNTGAKLRFTVKATGFVRHEFEHPQEITNTVETKGLATLDLGSVVPRASVLHTHALQAAKVIEVDGPDGKLDITTERTIDIKRE